MIPFPISETTWLGCIRDSGVVKTKASLLHKAVCQFLANVVESSGRFYCVRGCQSACCIRLVVEQYTVFVLGIDKF